MLWSSLKISETTNKEFLELMFFQIDKKNDKTTAVEIPAVFRTLQHVDSP